MATAIPITLVGDNLGKRHKYLNSLVNEASKKCEEFDDIKNLPEKSPIDRLFKIDLASKIRNVDYIIQNLKDDDMLYVSRALKATWLIDKQYEEIIINPKYLEERIYPEMINTAVNKMKHWIHLNLNDEMRCKQFFEYYREKDFVLAMKFFLKCSKNYILNEFKKIIHKVTPHDLKVLSEKCPEVAKIFFDSICNDDEVKRMYLPEQNDYFNVLRNLLKTNPEMVLDNTEKYFNRDCFKKFSPMQTKFIMKHHKNWFWKKPELYTAWLLNIQAVADSLNSEEAKGLILKIAQAKYLIILHNQSWFDYQRIEPILKRVLPEERAAFKKQVFVEKHIGERVEEWPYKIPKPPVNEIEYVTIFDDRQPEPREYERLNAVDFRKMLKKRKYAKWADEGVMECCSKEGKSKTILDKLFDEFRFVGFGEALYELRKRISAESSPKNREFMIFVLISKTGGRPDSVDLLLELLARLINEPANVRAAIIRSLVKRAQIWRLPETSWNKLIQFGQGLGLDGKTPEADCYEGLHAVVIRSLLQNGDCESDIKSKFLTHFSSLTDYSLNSSEKKIIASALPKMLLKLTMENEKNLFAATDCIEKLIQTLNAYKIKLETYPGFIDTIALLADKEVSPVDHLIRRLFDAKVARKQLFRFTVKLVITDESYLNALRHDATVLDSKIFSKCYGKFILHANRFFRKISLYFSEENGIASKYLQELKAQPSKIHGRLLAYLLNDEIVPYLTELDYLEDKNSKTLSSAIRANADLARPSLDINAFGWKKVGAKHVGNKLSKCRAVDIKHNVEELLKWKRTAKIAFALSKRTTYQTKVFIKFASVRPTSAIKSGLKLMKSPDEVDLLVWETIKPIIQELDITKTSRRHIVKKLENIDAVPMKIRPEYSTVIYTSLLKITLYDAMPSLCHVEILLSDVNEKFLESVVSQFLQNDFTIKTLSNDNKDIKCTCMFIRIFAKYLLLCKSVEEQKRRFELYGEPFLFVMEQLKESDEKKKLFEEYFPEMLLTLKYSKVFLNTTYVSPLPIMEKLIVWMRKHFTVAEHFKTYAQLHLLMLFYKATQQAIQLVPDIYSDNKRKRTEGVEIVGKIFGKYIASETANLQIQYFESVPELYVHGVVTFLQKFNYYYLSSDLLLSMIEGIFESEGSARRLGIYLIHELQYSLSDEHFQKLVSQTNKLDEQSQWLVFTL